MLLGRADEKLIKFPARVITPAGNQRIVFLLSYLQLRFGSLASGRRSLPFPPLEFHKFSTEFKFG